MWFKNLIIHRFTESFDISPEELHDTLTRAAFTPCGSQDLTSYGWTSPMGRHSDLLVHSSNGMMLICARKEEKILPASVIKEFVDEKALAIEEEQMRKVRKKERDEIRDEIMMDLTPKAFSRSSRTFALIAPQHNLLIVDSSSIKKAEELTSYLRKTLGSLPIRFPGIKQSPTDVFTRWIAEQDTPPETVEIGMDCELRDPGDEGGIIRCRKQDLSSQEVKAHIEAGKQVTKLAMEWDEKLSFALSEDLTVRSIKYGDSLLEQMEDSADEDFATKFDAEFTLMGMEICEFIPHLFDLFGGEQTSDAP